MLAASAAFNAKLVESHRVVIRAEVYRGGTLIASSEDGSLAVLSGDVRVDTTAKVRRSAKLAIVDHDGTLTPANGFDTLAPYGNELKLYRGLELDDGTEEVMPLGVFRIASAKARDGGAERVIDIDAFDRSRTVARNRLVAASYTPTGYNVALGIKALIDQQWRPKATPLNWRITSTSRTAAGAIVIEEQGDPWEGGVRMARSIGYELFFDTSGDPLLRPVPDSTTADVVWSYAEGEDAILLEAANVLSDDPGYNMVVALGEGTNLLDSFFGSATDNDPSSPTYAKGPYGRVPMFYRSPLIGSDAQAQDAASAILGNVIGGTEALESRSMVHPGHEGGDVVRFTRSELGIDDFYVLQAFNVPLTVDGTMTTTTRRRRGPGTFELG